MAKIQAKWIDFSQGFDIPETEFSGANNQYLAANITGFSFSPNVRSFMAQVSVTVDYDSDLTELFEIRGINNAGNWDLSISSSFDNSGVGFSIVGGQLQYTSQNYSNFNSLIIKFRATTTTI